MNKIKNPPISSEQRLLTLRVAVSHADGRFFCAHQDEFNVPIDVGPGYVQQEVLRAIDRFDTPKPGDLVATVSIDGSVVAEIDGLSSDEVTKGRKLIDKMFDEFTEVSKQRKAQGKQK